MTFWNIIYTESLFKGYDRRSTSIPLAQQNIASIFCSMLTDAMCDTRLTIISIVRKLVPPKFKHLAKDYYTLYRSKNMKRKRLKESEIKHIIRRRNDGVGVPTIAQEMKISARYVRDLWLRFCRSSRDISCVLPRPLGRPKANIAAEDIDAILDMNDCEPMGVVRMTKRLKTQGHNISYHAVYRTMKNNNLVTPSNAKSGQRKWVRYERKYSNAMWHVDWHIMKDPRLKGLNLVAYLDDASRCITGFGIFDTAESINAVKVLRTAIKKFGTPATILSDNGRNFVTRRNSPPKKKWAATVFEEELLECGIGLINSRPYHPETNGKIERFFRTLETELIHRENIRVYMDYYNEQRLHFSLDIDNGEAPLEAFAKKKASDAIRKNDPKWMERDT